jgi:hypothetical protein
LREFVEGEGVGGTEFLLPLGGAEDVPALYGYPEDAGYVRGGEDTVDLEEIVVAFGAGHVGDNARAAFVLFEPHPGEHLAADGFVAYPEDEAAELYRLHGMREGEEIGADAFDVDAISLRVPPLPGGYFGGNSFLLW